jgi:PAS domain S-box-containing protein
MSSVEQKIKDLTADILTGIVDGVVVTDAQGQVIIWNRAAEEMTGIAAAEALGKGMNVVLADNPAVVSQIEKTFTTALLL